MAREATPRDGPGPLKIVVIDDDPTGSQTVHSCPLLLRWDHPTLVAGLRRPSPLLFVLANTRALDPAAAAERVRQICRSLQRALSAAGVSRWLIVSRGDSTLRGHFPLEVNVIARELGPFDATLLVPAFLEGGRTTVAGVHRLDGQPVHETPFARDRLFGYRSSYLPEWVQEKSGGTIRSQQVERIGLEELEEGRPTMGSGRNPVRRLAALEGNPIVAVDAERAEHLTALAGAVRQLTGGAAAVHGGRRKRFLFQSAASLLNALAELPPQPLDAAGLAALRRLDPSGAALPGLVLVGSHVPLADRQLEALLAESGCGGVEVEVARVHRVLEGPLPDRLLASLEDEWLQRLTGVLASGRTAVLHTSRGELVCRHAAERRALGLALAGLMARLAGRLAAQLGYVISKGGITTHTLLADGLGLAMVDLQGQILPGLSVVLTPDRGSGPLPVLTVPGNLGDTGTLVEAWRWMENGDPGPIARG